MKTCDFVAAKACSNYSVDSQVFVAEGESNGLSLHLDDRAACRRGRSGSARGP